MTIGFDGLVLAGGRAARMGQPKPALAVAGRTLLSSAVGALRNAGEVIVVGPGGDVQEEPPYGGPVAAVAAGLPLLSAGVVVVLAADLPFVTAAAIETLVRHAPAVAIDDAGRPQLLLAAYRTDELRLALPADPAGASMRSVVSGMALRRVTLDGSPPPWWDCDTPIQLAQARSWR